MKDLAYYNGDIAAVADMRVPMTDRACFFGDGIYDMTFAANGVIHDCAAHIDRFFEGADRIGIKPDFDKLKLSDLLISLVAKVDAVVMSVYWQITRGTSDRAHAFPSVKPNLWVMLRPTVLTDIYRRVKLVTFEDIRYHYCNIKTINLLPNVLAAEAAKAADAYEAVFHRGDRVTECAHSNVYILQNGTLQTAPADCDILPGISRANMLRAAAALGIPVSENAFSVSDLFSSDEVLVSSTSVFCISASHVDGKPAGGKAPALLKRLQDHLMEEYRREVGLG
jgi:D-alanine transaminase